MSFHQTLRSATQPSHQALESCLGLPQTLDEHIARLKKFYGFHHPWESAIAPHLVHLPLANRRKLHLLDADLRHFGIDPSRLPLCTQLPAIADTPSALGSLYVLEGSTLGGQLIARRLESTFQLSNRLGYSYYLPYGTDTPQMWLTFKSLLESHGTPKTISAAIQTFETLNRWL